MLVITVVYWVGELAHNLLRSWGGMSNGGNRSHENFSCTQVLCTCVSRCCNGLCRSTSGQQVVVAGQSWLQL